MFFFCLCGCDSSSTLLSEPLTDPSRQIHTQQLGQFLFDSAAFISPEVSPETENYVFADLDNDQIDERISFLILSQEAQTRVEVSIYKLFGESYRRIAAIRNTCDTLYDFQIARVSENETVMVIGWGLENAESHGISICTLDGDKIETLYGGHCTAMSVADFDNDSFDEILVARAGTPNVVGSVTMIDSVDGILSPVSRVSLSANLTSFSNVITAPIGFEQIAMICEGYIDGVGYISDYIVCVNGMLKNVFLSEYTAVSSQTARNFPIWSADIDGNGYVELPALREVPSIFNHQTPPYSLWFVDWMQCGDTGMASLVLTTYHDFQDAWYLILPQNMSNNVTVEISLDTEDCRATRFYYWSDEGERTLPIWEVFVFTGEDAIERMEMLAFDTIAYVHPTAYSLVFYNNVYGFSYSKRTLSENFFAYGVPQLEESYASLFDFSAK